MKDTASRFWSKAKHSNGCWRWTGGLSHGYGIFRMKDKTYLAHRVAWEMEYGRIPAGMQVCHKCDTPECIRPKHLFLGTQQDNMQDALKKGRRRKEGYNIKLTKEQIKRIRLDTTTNRVLANKYGVHINTIWNIKNKKTWKNV